VYGSVGGAYGLAGGGAYGLADGGAYGLAGGDEVGSPYGGCWPYGS
jgi:hypothetical protein